MELHGFKNYHAYHSWGGKHILRDLLYCYVESTVLNAVSKTEMAPFPKDLATVWERVSLQL